ncbi:hypothetical protein COT30_04595 [Candidatus Micrarchaeota archaeon CG08_land_8_20_14_0_20_49_17]|nr:MAG: hypothetical protein COT30_04595 [Candidatus Micrarchaeota archaeon CG08_land_8_20_14_0_20_49_17]HII54092.1 hypothetical protein [Candidatus Micrarchaeota archaeon]
MGEYLAPHAKEFLFSKHYQEDKDIDTELTINCIYTGKRMLDEEPNKFKSRKKYRCGELIVVYREYGDYYFVITAFWNIRGDKR